MAQDANVKTSRQYYAKYDVVQAHKHALLEHYLGGWFPKIANSGSRKAIYLETHAGRGIHETGNLGSPLVAIHVLQKHPQKERILARCAVNFHLIELVEENVAILERMVAQEPRHERIEIFVEQGDFASKFRGHLDNLVAKDKRLAPTLVFMDPFGYGLPMDIVKRVLDYKSCEVMVNFMAGPVARAARDASKGPNLDLLYGCDRWRDAIGIEPLDAQAERMIAIYSECVGAKWSTKLRITGQTDYSLIHFTNHDEGRATMKRSVWAITKDLGREGGDQVFAKDVPGQDFLILPEVDLEPLKDAFRARWNGKTFVYEDVVSWLVGENYVETQLHKIMGEARDEGWLKTSFTARFGPSAKGVEMEIPGSLF